MTDIQVIMSMLHWHNDEDIWQKGIDLARKETDLQPFMQPLEYGDKAVWDGCAKIICERSDAELSPYLHPLLEWLQDINWPGAIFILVRMRRFSGKMLKSSFEENVNKAAENDDEQWLRSLAQLLYNEDLEKEILPSCKEVLQKYYTKCDWETWLKTHPILSKGRLV